MQIENDEVFVVDTDVKAEWCITKLKEEQEQTERLKNISKQMIEMYQEKIKELDEKHQSKTAYLKSQLNSYFQTVERKITKTQETYKLVTATLKLKHKNPKIIQDAEKLLEYLENNNHQEYIETVKKPKWGEFKKQLKQVNNKYVDEDGQIVEGVTLEELPSEFIIEIKGEK